MSLLCYCYVIAVAFMHYATTMTQTCKDTKKSKSYKDTNIKDTKNTKRYTDAK